MTRPFLFVLATVAMLNVQAGHGYGGPDKLEKCLMAAQAIRAGSFVKLEYLGFTDEGTSSYEIEIRDPDGNEWEFECSTRTGEILEIEQEVDSPESPLFKRNMKISEQQARKIATDLYPGTIEEVEYEIEANGDASYEFDIVDKYGVEFKIEVDATTGDIVEVQIERWEIGEEDRL
ncbi:MAG TPA: PepSY domain-containing protein [Gammaproteobacteria bacterium]|nr:PepSY domain-containing protein [Gammaproteobacteria bacterium]